MQNIPNLDAVELQHLQLYKQNLQYEIYLVGSLMLLEC